MQNQRKQKDRQLWRFLREGKREALSELFLAHSDSLYQYGYILCNNRELVEDCMQDLFLHLWKKRKKLSDVQHVKTYLMIALRHRIRDSFRKSQRSNLLVDIQSIDEQPVSASVEEDWVQAERKDQQSQLISQALNVLPDRMRQAIHLRYFEGFDYPVIAEIMNVKPQVAVNMVYRATKKLRAYSERHSEWLFFCLLSLLF